MKIRRKYNNYIPQILGVAGITLYPFILLARPLSYWKEYPDRLELILKHEYLHINQVRELGVFWFYFTYFFKVRHYEDPAYRTKTEKPSSEVLAAVHEDLSK